MLSVDERIKVIHGLANEDVERATRGLDLSKQFYMVAGVPIIPVCPRQKTGNVNELYQDAAAGLREFEHMVQEYARKGSAADFDMVRTKTVERTLAKAKDDYKGDVSRVCDVIRACIKIDKPSQYRKVTDLLLPATNSSVIRLQDGFASQNNPSGLRRVLANVVLSNGHIAEIQVRHIAMEKAYEETSELYRRVRAMQSRLKDASETLSYNQIEGLTKSISHMERERKTIHTAAAKKMANVVVEREFNFVNGFPVMLVYDRYTKDYRTVVPDAKTGYFIEDNRFLPALTSDQYSVERNVMREVFLARSLAVASSESRPHLQLVA